MKVICIFDFIESHLAKIKGKTIKYGETYTVKSEQYGYSTFGKREVDAYELVEVEGLYEKGIFIPVDENKFDTILSAVLRVPKRKKTKQPNKESEFTKLANDVLKWLK